MNTKNIRLESDSIGTLELDADAYYGVQALRGKNNFSITNTRLNTYFINNLAKIKLAAALVNEETNALTHEQARAIENACKDIMNGMLHEEFIVDAIQGGAGTSANMNANEVIANRAIEYLHGTKGDYSLIHPNDHINMCQSTNDVIPTAGKLTVLDLLKELDDTIDALEKALLKKSDEFDHILKLGRTQLEDAVPMRLGQTFHAYASMLHRDHARISKIKEELLVVNMGATAIGTSINATPHYLSNITPKLAKITGYDLKQADDLFDCTENLDSFVAISSAIKTCALNMSKMSNDLRLLASGPTAGLGEITLPAKQNGSSIMPGKVNPVIPEVVSQVAYRIAGNDVTISMAAEAGQMELNAFEPVVFYSLFESIQILSHALQTLRINCIEGIVANEDRCRELLEKSVGIVTALNPIIGYKKSAELAKKSLATHTPLKELVVKEHILSKDELSKILDPYQMTEVKPENKEA